MKGLVLIAILIGFIAVTAANAEVTTTVRVLSPPIFVDIIVQPSNPDASQDLGCNATIIDPYDTKIEYSWLKNGAETGISTKILPKTALKDGEEWTCIVTASNQYGKDSANYTVKIIIPSQITGKIIEPIEKNYFSAFFDWLFSLFRLS